MKSNYQGVKGTQDFFGENIDKFNYVVDAAKNVAKFYNFKEIKTPLIEFSNLFERSVGDGSDIVLKELYKFEDKGGEVIALRPEFTAGVVRALAENGDLNQNLPQKLFSYGDVFRYDRPQKGRYREFNQLNFEIYGNDDYMADVETISVLNDILQNLGLKNITLEINSLGSNKCKIKYENALREYFTPLKDKLSEDSKKRLDKNPLRILDSKEDCDKELLKNAPKINEFYTDEERTFYANVLKSIGELGIKYYDNPGLVRGLDYYTSIVFEFTTTDLGAQSAVGGGGRYDNLVEQIGNIPISAVGFGSGIERLMLLLDKKMEKKDELIAVIPISENENSYTLKLVKELQAKGKSIEYIYSGKFKKKMDKMNKCGADFAIVVGEDEVKTGKLKIKDLKSGEEKEFVL
ncbi:MAG: histidine--tRNA ligase [Rickettsiales bacterium]|nr:MAG: histidine--tRNA ligase [Rickettsiales bacterium]